jgi:hypothetical protein
MIVALSTMDFLDLASIKQQAYALLEGHPAAEHNRAEWL